MLKCVRTATNYVHVCALCMYFASYREDDEESVHYWSRCLWIVCHEAVECLRPSPRDCCVRAVKGSGWSLGVPRRSRCRPRWILCARTHVQEHEVCIPAMHPPHLALCQATTAPTPPCLVSGHHCTHPTLPRVSVKYTADMPYDVDSQCACIRNSKYIVLLMKAHIPKPPEISVD